MKREARWCVEATYPSALYFEGGCGEHEAKLEKAVGRMSDGSGMGFYRGGGRDVAWDYVQRKSAEKAAAKLRRFKWVKRVKIHDLLEGDE
jgi:hypothetical protein